MSDITPPPPPSEDGRSQVSELAAVVTEAIQIEGAQNRRRWGILSRTMKKDRQRRDRTALIAALTTIVSAALVAFAGVYATMRVSNDSRLENRRSQRIDALVEQWSVSIADASSAVEIMGQRSNDLWAYGAALEQQGVVLDEAIVNEGVKEKDYFKVRKELAFSTAKAGLVSSALTNECLDRFITLLDTWQNALSWTRSTLQIEDGAAQGIEAVALQSDNRSSLTKALTVVRQLARAELAAAGDDVTTVKCDIQSEDDLWASLIPESANG